MERYHHLPPFMKNKKSLTKEEILAILEEAVSLQGPMTWRDTDIVKDFRILLDKKIDNGSRNQPRR